MQTKIKLDKAILIYQGNKFIKEVRTNKLLLQSYLDNNFNSILPPDILGVIKAIGKIDNINYDLVIINYDSNLD